MRWDRYIAIIGRITQRPEVWNQEWSGPHSACGSAFCVFGHANVDAGYRLDRYHDAEEVFERGYEWLGADEYEAEWIWDHRRTLAQLQDLAITQKFPWEKESQP